MIKQPCEFFEHPNDTYYHPYEVHPYQTGDQPCECIRVVLKNIRVRFVRVRTQFNFRLTHIHTRGCEVHPCQTSKQPCEYIRVVRQIIRVRFVRMRTQFIIRVTHIHTRVEYIRVRQVNNRVNASVWYGKTSVSGSSV